MLKWLLLFLRICVGLLIIKTGIDFSQGHFAFSGFAGQQPFFTGLFTILIGIHVIFSSIFK